MKALVTGGAGCIGTEVVSLLLSQGHSVVLFDLPEQIVRARGLLPIDTKNLTIMPGSVLDADLLKQATQGCDTVFHLAAMLGVAHTEGDYLRCWTTNVIGTKNVCEAAALTRVQRLVFASSSEVYGEPIENPVHELVPTQGKTNYGVTKMASEELLRGYAQRGYFKVTVCRLFNTYGHGQVRQFVLTKFVWQVINNINPTINGDGTQTRSYCFAEDTAKGMILSLRSIKDYDVFNIGNSNDPISLLELASKIKEIVSPVSTIQIRSSEEYHDRVSSREINVRICDTTKAKNLLGFEATIPLEDGINRINTRRIFYPDWSIHGD